MHPADIKAAIERAGITQAAIARQLHVSPVTIHDVIRGRTRSKRVASAIAKITGLGLDQLWPGTYEKRRVA